MHTLGTLIKESCSSETNLYKEWYRWCRLCAKANVQCINIYAKDKNTRKSKSVDHDHIRLLIATSKYFSVDITQDDNLSNQLCVKCVSFLNSLIHFNIHVNKVQKMYAALRSTQKDISLDTPSLRLKYGVLEDDRPHGFMYRLLPEKDLCSSVGYSSESDSGSNMKTKRQHDSVIHMRTAFENTFNNDAVENSRNIQNVTESQDNNNGGEEITSEPEERGKLNSSDTKPTEYKYDCDKCTQRFRRIGSFRLHMNKKHGILDQLQNVSCSKCFRSFKNTALLKRHMKVHRPNSEKEVYPCPQCDRKFQTNYYVTTHIKLAHEGLRQFICEECGKAMRTQASLNDHMLTHTDYAPFRCETCNRGFKSRRRLKTHADIHSSDNHTCDKCGLQLSSRTTLSRHKLVHSDVMEHKCDYCGRAFKRAISLKDHLLLHSGLKPYSCNFCDKTFGNSSNCRIHMKRIHPNEFIELMASGIKSRAPNVPKLAVLKSVVKSSQNLVPVVSKYGGNFAFGIKPKTQLDNNAKLYDSKLPQSTTASNSEAAVIANA